MSFKSVLAAIGATDARSDLGRAIEVATELDAHLSVAVTGLATPPTIGDFPAGTVWLDQRENDLKTLGTIGEAVEADCKANGLSFEVAQIYAEGIFISEEICRRALYADVLVVGNGLRQDLLLTKRVVDGALFEAHCPVFVAARGRKASLKPERILLAWNSRPEAARAAREALDMMVAAKEVHVVLVDPDNSFWRSGGEPGADIATHLARHGVKATVERLASSGRPVKEVLEQHALDMQADLIVMGGYGHSRLRERIFGGVTASMLDENRFPVFIAR